MKIIAFILLLALLLFSVALAEPEITFQKIPWLSDVDSSFGLLVDSGFMQDGVSDTTITSDSVLYIIENDIGFILPDCISGVDDVSFSINLGGIIKGKIASYPIKNVIMSFAYDGEYKLIAVKVELLNAKYDELKGKLTTVYGEGETRYDDEEGIESVVWKGGNDSAVLLYTQSEGLKYTLMYGRLDAAEILTNCLATDPDDVSGL